MEKKKQTKEVEKKSYKTWSKRIKKNDTTEEIEVKEAENGFVVTHYVSGYTKGNNGDKQWFDKSKTYITKENPLEDEEEKSFSESIDGILDEIAESEGMINV